MTVQEFVAELNAWWKQTYQNAVGSKMPELAGEELDRLYGRFDPDERRVAHGVFIEWALSEDPTKRFDGLRMIDALGLVEALPALQTLSEALSRQSTPSAPHDRAWVDRITDRLGGIELAAGEDDDTESLRLS